ncbi:Trypsin [Orchesella cincta]|uniref:Trypsin n=1 Tax=Orchesella cincta TaxID=48709 RepID=A0A1D2MKF1_ORCCI|nr:Trypsin [Orchesella cincta]
MHYEAHSKIQVQETNIQINSEIKMIRKLCLIAVCVALFNKSEAIIGGEDATKNEFPWLVRFAVGQNFCSGALIDMDLVLTSASCVRYYTESVEVVAGDHSLLQDDGTEQTLLSHYPIIHEDFNKNGNLENDIALIRLFSAFQQTSNIRTIQLPISNPHQADAGRAVLAGWGETTIAAGDSGKLRFFPGLSPVLQKTNLGYTNASYCAENFDVTLPASQFCTHGNGGAPMDKGGPLLCDDQPNQVCGILSNVWLSHSEHDTTVGSYVQVRDYIGWISVNRVKTTLPTVAPTTPSAGGGGSGGGDEITYPGSGVGTIVVKIENNTSTLMLCLLLTFCVILILASAVLMWKFLSVGKPSSNRSESRIDLSRDFYRNASPVSEKHESV